MDTNFADGDAVCSITSMYNAETGVIFTTGGAPNSHCWHDAGKMGPKDNHRKEATNNAFEINIGEVEPGKTVKPKKVASMRDQRGSANALILPNGETFVVGGQRRNLATNSGDLLTGDKEVERSGSPFHASRIPFLGRALT